MAAQASRNQHHLASTGSRPKSSHGKPKQASGTPNAGVKIHTVKLNYNYKQIKCMEKSDFFKSRIPPGIDVSIEGDTIELKGQDIQVLKLAKYNVEKCKESLKLASLSIHSMQAQILKKSDVINFINECLDIDNMVVTWDVIEVADQVRLNVFSFDKNLADEMIKKVMACIAEERVRIDEIKLPWFQNLLRNEQSKLTITKLSAGDIIVYTTIDVSETYFVENRRSKCSVGQQLASNQLIKGKHSINTTKQPSAANQQVPPRDIKDKYSKEMEEKQAYESKETNTKNSAQVVKTSGILPPSHWSDMAAQASRNQHHLASTGSRPKSSHGKPKQASGTPNAGVKIHTVKLYYNYKQIKCMEKSDFFKSRIPPGIDVSIEGDTIELKGQDIQVLKLAKDYVEKCKESLKLASLSIHSMQAQILKKSDVINFINECLDIDNMVVTWDVIEVADQVRLNVFSFDKNLADVMIKKVMACIAEERVRIDETRLPWFQNLLRNEQSKLTITKSSAGDIIVYTTIDASETYFVENRRSKCSVGQQLASNQLITGKHSTDTTKQPSAANQQVPPRDIKDKYSKEMEEKQAYESKETNTKNSAQVVKTSGILPPSHWSDMGNENFLKIAIKPRDDSCQNYEWENIQTKFETTLPQARIVSIYRIQNIFMWEHFYLKKRQFEHAYGKGCSNQLSLFHGTTPDMLDVILEQNLDPRKAGDRGGARLGQGTYFAISPEYSDLYALSDSQGHKFMFLVNVLAGKSCIGKTDYKRPPLNPDMKSRLFDSCVDNVQNPKVYCIFHDSQYYLKYLIEYT